MLVRQEMYQISYFFEKIGIKGYFYSLEDSFFWSVQGDENCLYSQLVLCGGDGRIGYVWNEDNE